MPATRRGGGCTRKDPPALALALVGQILTFELAPIRDRQHGVPLLRGSAGFANHTAKVGNTPIGEKRRSQMNLHSSMP